MDIETTKAKMMEQVDEARHSAMAGNLGWAFVVEDRIVYVTLPRRKEPSRDYLLRVQFDDFPKRAPSYMFIDPITRQNVPDAWPSGVMHSESRICTPGTREFHEHLHANDAQYPWDPGRYTFLSTVRMIHRLM